VDQLFSYGAIETKDTTKNIIFKVNGQRLKHFLEMPNEEDVECLLIHEFSQL